jgi:hypothetical protein
MKKLAVYVVLLGGLFALAARANKIQPLGNGPEPIPQCPDGVCAK